MSLRFWIYSGLSILTAAIALTLWLFWSRA